MMMHPDQLKSLPIVQESLMTITQSVCAERGPRLEEG